MNIPTEALITVILGAATVAQQLLSSVHMHAMRSLDRYSVSDFIIWPPVFRSVKPFFSFQLYLS